MIFWCHGADKSWILIVWFEWWSVRLVIERSLIQLSPTALWSIWPLNKRLSHTCLYCHHSTSGESVMLRIYEGNRRCGVAMAMRQQTLWYIHQPAQSPKAGWWAVTPMTVYMHYMIPFTETETMSSSHSCLWMYMMTQRTKDFIMWGGSQGLIQKFSQGT